MIIFFFNGFSFYLKAAKANCEVENRAKSVAVISLLDHERLFFWPSTVAAGLVILASLAVNREPSCNRVMEVHDNILIASADIPPLF